MFKQAIQIGALALLLLHANAFAQTSAPSEPPYDPAVEQDMRGRCETDCFKAAAQCAVAPDTKESPAVCDTRAIACFVACPKCVAGYRTCRTDPAGAKGIFACTRVEFECVATAKGAAEHRTDLIRFTGGDGKAIETAVAIEGARNEDEGVVAELYWASRILPGWRKDRQGLARRPGKVYDRITFVSPTKERLEVFFDISAFFGKM